MFPHTAETPSHSKDQTCSRSRPIGDIKLNQMWLWQQWNHTALTCKIERTFFVSRVYWTTLRSPTANLRSALACRYICPGHNSTCYFHPKVLSHICSGVKRSSHRIKLVWLPYRIENSLWTSSNVIAASSQCYRTRLFTSDICFSLLGIAVADRELRAPALRPRYNDRLNSRVK